MRVILASASPRRRELFAQILPEFEVIPSDAEEILTKEDPGEIAMELAREKAEAVAETTVGAKACQKTVQSGGQSGIRMPKVGAEPAPDDLLILGADTIVVQDQRILGKPRDKEDAFRMLSALSGRTHEVYTGVCLLGRCGGAPFRHTFFEKTIVEFYPMTDAEIRAYVNTGDPMDKAGAYGIQSGCGRYIRGICGDYNNVVGLPLSGLYHAMRDLGFFPVK